MRVNNLVATRMATFEYDFDSIQKKNEDLSFDIEDPYWNPNRKITNNKWFCISRCNFG